MYTYNYLSDRGVSRLCHFTKLKDLTHIIASDNGISATNTIPPDIKNQKDYARYDGELEHICCSVEYPNSWYLRNLLQRDNDNIFKDWVIIYVDLQILNHRSAKFSPCNASKDRGAHIFNDERLISSLFDSPLFNGRERTPQMLKCCPTDDQAEILIKNTIPYEFFKGIAVCNEEVAQRVYSIIRTFNKPIIPIYIAPDVFSTACSNTIRMGLKPYEKEFIIEKEELV